MSLLFAFALFCMPSGNMRAADLENLQCYSGIDCTGVEYGLADSISECADRGGHSMVIGGVCHAIE